MSKKRVNQSAISIETDLKEALLYLESLGAKKNKAMKNLLGKVGTLASKKVRKAYKANGLKKRTGALYKSIKRKVLKNGKAVMVSALALSKTNIFYGYALAQGSEIRAAKKDYLTFQVNGKWVKKKEVKLPKRDFVSKPVVNYLRTVEFKENLDLIVQKEVEKLEKKAKENKK